MARGRSRGWRDPGKERYWRRMVRQWERSGLSVREFCDWQALSEPSFYAWRRELANRDRRARSSAGRKSGNRAAERKGAAVGGTPAFLPVRVLTDAAIEARGDGRCVEVQLPTGVQLRVPAGFDRQTLADVLSALEARPC